MQLAPCPRGWLFRKEICRGQQRHMVLAVGHAEWGWSRHACSNGSRGACAASHQWWRCRSAQGKQPPPPHTHTLSSRSACQAKKIAIKYAAGACVVKMFQATTSAGHDGSDVLLRRLGVRCMYTTEPFGMLQCAGSMMQEVCNAVLSVCLCQPPNDSQELQGGQCAPRGRQRATQLVLAEPPAQHLNSACYHVQPRAAIGGCHNACVTHAATSTTRVLDMLMFFCFMRLAVQTRVMEAAC
jgi:hypothetical protein